MRKRCGAGKLFVLLHSESVFRGMQMCPMPLVGNGEVPKSTFEKTGGLGLGPTA